MERESHGRDDLKLGGEPPFVRPRDAFSTPEFHPSLRGNNLPSPIFSPSALNLMEFLHVPPPFDGKQRAGYYGSLRCPRRIECTTANISILGLSV